MFATVTSTRSENWAKAYELNIAANRVNASTRDGISSRPFFPVIGTYGSHDYQRPKRGDISAILANAVATAPAVWLLIDRGAIQLDDPVSLHLASRSEECWRAITVRHLLTHTSGLPPFLMEQSLRDRAEVHRRIAAIRPTFRPGLVFRYSDANFIVLRELVEAVTGTSLDEFCRENIFQPLGMRETGVRPLSTLRIDASRIAPTERVGGVVLRGVPLDPTARVLGGVAGHAGLFSSASDLARFCRAILAGGQTLWTGQTVAAMTGNLSPAPVALRRGGGFDINTSFSAPRGDIFPRGSCGHTGWTGCFFWIDLASRSFYIVLSNRTHPEGEGSVHRLQREIGNLAGLAAYPTARQQLDLGPTRDTHRALLYPRRGSTGIDVLQSSNFAAIIDRTIGLIVDTCARDSAGNPTENVLLAVPQTKVEALYLLRNDRCGMRDLEPLFAGAYRPSKVIFHPEGANPPTLPAALDAIVIDVEFDALDERSVNSLQALLDAATAQSIRLLVAEHRAEYGGSWSPARGQ